MQVTRKLSEKIAGPNHQSSDQLHVRAGIVLPPRPWLCGKEDYTVKPNGRQECNFTTNTDQGLHFNYKQFNNKWVCWFLQSNVKNQHMHFNFNIFLFI